MTISQLLHNMCAELGDADLNAIRKARGFSASETASRSSFASFFLTPVGVAAAMQALSPEEAITLRLLHETGEVGVQFFERLYTLGTRKGTFTQKYKTVFDDVKKNLVRRGLLVMAEVKTRGESVQLERWRYALPPEFAPFLPQLPSVRSEQPGQPNDALLRKKLLTLVGGGPAVANDYIPLVLTNGQLYLKDFPFAIPSLQIWQMTAWSSDLLTFQPNVPSSLDPTHAALNLLSAETWMAPKTLEPALKIYCFGGKIPPAESLLHKGWELGLVDRLGINGVYHYRQAAAYNPVGANEPYPATLAWADPVSSPGKVKIDLRVAPLHDLELLNGLAHLSVENGELWASPSIVKLGRATPHQRASRLSDWLADSVPAFGRALQTVEEKWGRTLLHENLLFARVRDLSLRVQLERELKDKLVVLSEHFVAFPVEARSSVEKVLKKTGFVTKIVKP